MFNNRLVLHSNPSGFTLIEMSIVLVIIGLIIGGILVGQDLIRSAYIRAQISQIEKFNTAVNTFYGKYQALPGDMNATTAQNYGFYTRCTHSSSMIGHGDGNGVLETIDLGTPLPAGLEQSYVANGCFFEITMFWVDLTTANGLNLNLISGSFTIPPLINAFPPPSTPDYFIPQAKLGAGNYVYAWGVNGINYWGVSGVSTADTTGYSLHDLYADITVQQAYRIDQKTDDGFPQSGNVTAQFIGNNCFGSSCEAFKIWPGGDNGPTDTTTATPPSSTSCYDDGGHTGSIRQYSVSTNRGNAANCVLAFKFQ